MDSKTNNFEKTNIFVVGDEWEKIPGALKNFNIKDEGQFVNISLPIDEGNVFSRDVQDGRILYFILYSEKNNDSSFVTIYLENGKETKVSIVKNELNKQDVIIPSNYRNLVENEIRNKGFWVPCYNSSENGTFLDHFVNAITGEVKSIFQFVDINKFKDFEETTFLSCKMDLAGLEMSAREFGDPNLFLGMIGKNKSVFDAFYLCFYGEERAFDINWISDGLIQKAQKIAAFSLFNKIFYDDDYLEKSSVYSEDENGEKKKEIKTKDIIPYDMPVTGIVFRDSLMNEIISAQNNIALDPQKFFIGGIEENNFAPGGKLMLSNGVLYSITDKDSIEIGKWVDLVSKNRIDFRLVDNLFGYIQMF